MSESNRPDAEADLDKTGTGSEPVGQRSEDWSAGSPPAQGEALETTPSEESAPKRKRYYSPGEVMQKKGCIGCGAMVLTIALAAAALATVLVLF